VPAKRPARPAQCRPADTTVDASNITMRISDLTPYGTASLSPASAVDLTKTAAGPSLSQRNPRADGVAAATLIKIGAHDELDRRLLLREHLHHPAGLLRGLRALD
jgi:hypothetical protein